MTTEYEWTLNGEPLRRKGGPGSGHHGHVGRPGQVGGSAPGKSGNGSVVHDVHEHGLANLQKAQDSLWQTSQARRTGMSREEFDKTARILENDLLSTAQVTLGTGLGTAIKIGQNGKILGRESSGHSEGTLATGMERREKFDEAIGENFVYATLGLTDAPYGTVRMILDKSVLGQATATNGDSLDQVVGKSRLDKGDLGEIREQFARWAIPATVAHSLLAHKLASNLHPTAIREILGSGKIDNNMRKHLSNKELEIPYVEIQIPTKGTAGLSTQSISGILYRTLYPGKVFESDREQRRSLRSLFPGIPIKESDQTRLYALLQFGELPSLAIE